MWYCTEGTSNPKIIDTGRFDRMEKKASIDYDEDIPTLLNQSHADLTFFQIFVFTGFCLRERGCGNTLVEGACSGGHFQSLLWGLSCPPLARRRCTCTPGRAGPQGWGAGMGHAGGADPEEPWGPSGLCTPVPSRGTGVHWKCSKNRERRACCNFSILFLISLKESSSWQ